MTSDFYQHPVRRIASRRLTLDYLVEAGPRLVRLFLDGASRNVLGEIPHTSWPTPFGPYSPYGGHRLWHSPEAFPRSNIPDNSGLAIEEIEGGVRLAQPAEPGTGIAKGMEIRLDENEPRLTIDHSLRNESLWPVELSAWAITIFPLGGVAIFPQTQQPADEHRLLPNRNLVAWPYTSWRDSRLELHDDIFLLHARPSLPPCKLGYLNPHGWLAYLNADILFVKQFEPKPERPYPDFGCNTETYCNDQMIELESLSPLTRLEPGAEVKHRETWRLFHQPGRAATIESLRQMIMELGL